MEELNLSSYIKILRPGLKQNDKQESAGRLLLNSINDQDYVINHGYHIDSLSSKKISQLVNQIIPVPDSLRQASMEKTVINQTIDYFRDEVMNDLNPHLKFDTIDALIRLIDSDETIPPDKRKDLMKYHEAGDDAHFLASTFLYALNRPNKKADDSVSDEDIPLLAEANFECPVCQRKLVETVKGHPVKRYRITQIFPDTLDKVTASEFEDAVPSPAKGNKPENLIALDKGCSERYLLNPTLEEYKKLREVKETLSRSYKAKTAISTFQLEEDIRTILSSLNQIRDDSDLVDLEYNALHIEEKFAPENFILKKQTQMQVVQYYRYIEKTFSESDCDFDIIASEIRISSNKLEKGGLSQAEVINYLSEWIRNKAGLGSESKLASDIVVSFFIQNCEVFHK